MSGGEPSALEGIAIVGTAGRFPGANSVDALWENVKAGVESITFFPKEQLEARDPTALADRPDYIRARGILADVDLFDAAFFGYSPKEAEVMDPQHRLFLECAWEALEDAGYDPNRYPGSIGVYAGQSLNTYLLANLAAHRKFLDELTGQFQVGQYTTVLGNDKDYLTSRVCYKFNLKGPGVTVQSACSTSLVAVAQACQSLLAYQTDMVLAGGVSITFPQRRGYLYQEGGMVSADGHVRSFDADAQGTVFSSGVAVVLLKRLEDAVADRDHIYAVIKGSAINNDGNLKVGYVAPSLQRQAELIATAQALAGVTADTIGFIEAHGTGTPLGDPIEVEALTRAFRETTDRVGFCALGTVKTNVGHLESASGATGLIKTALMVEHALIPPVLHFKAPNPKIDFAKSPFFVNTATKPWDGNGLRRAGVSSFGVGGTNAHVVVEQAPLRAASVERRTARLLTLSARSEAALVSARERLAAHIATHPELSLGDSAHTLQTGRRAFPFRFSATVSDAQDAVAALAPSSKRGSRGNASSGEARVAFMFPGQGAQEVGMGAQLYRAEPTFRAEVDACCELLRPVLGVDLRELAFQDARHGPELEEQLNQTAITQPSLFIIEYALAKLWEEWGIRPAAMIGHSVGEYVAACLAGVFSRDDALKLVATRGRLIQGLPRGAMLAIRLPEAEVRLLLRPGLDIAACNGPALTVAAGPLDAIDAFEKELTARGLIHRRLRTSHAFHSGMMEPILPEFAREVAKVHLGKPAIPFVSSVTGTWVTEADAQSAQYWARHVRHTVAFTQGIHELQREPNRVLLEVGPGRTLATLARQSQPPIPPLDVLTSFREGGVAESTAVVETLGRLWTLGASPDWAGFHRDESLARVRLPTYPFERKRFWVDPPPLGASLETNGAVQPEQGRGPDSTGDELERVVQEQLELMAQQLEVLRNTSS